MSVILALETTSDVCSVAVGTVDEYVLETRHAPRQHNQLILPMIEAACASLGINRRVIECVAFSAGPGSFTGVRLGAAVAQGIATGVNAQIYGAPTSLCMGERVLRLMRPQAAFYVQRNSRRDLVYEAKLHCDGEMCRFVEKDKLIQIDATDSQGHVFTDNTVSLCASDVLRLAAQDRSHWQAPIYALPIYVEGDHPWRPVQQRRD